MAEHEQAGERPADDFTYDVDAGERSTPFGFLLDAVWRRDLGRQVLSVFTAVLFASGGGLMAFPYLTDLYANQFVQGNAEEEFALIQQGVSTFEEWEGTVVGNDGVALIKIAIPAIGLETLVVEGTSASALRAGAGHYPETPLPGQPGNVGIAGHRTTYGRPFNQLDELDVDDTIWIATPVGDHEYRVVRGDGISDDCVPSTERADAAACITHPGDWSVVTPPDDADASWLTLTTCHPKGSAARRLIIRAELVESYPAGTYDERIRG